MTQQRTRGKTKGRKEERKNEKIPRKDGGAGRARLLATTLCVRMQILVRFAAGRHLFVTHSRPYTVADSTVQTRLAVSARRGLTSNSSFSSATSAQSRDRPPLDNPTLSLGFVPPFEFPSDLGDRVPCHNYLPPSSRHGYFCLRIAPPPPHTAVYFSINYAAVRKHWL